MGAREIRGEGLKASASTSFAAPGRVSRKCIAGRSRALVDVIVAAAVSLRQEMSSRLSSPPLRQIPLSFRRDAALLGIMLQRR